MVAQTRLTLIANPGETPSHADTHDHRHVTVLAVVIGAALIGLLPVLVPAIATPSGDVAAHVQPTPGEAAPVDYFPAQFQNQAQSAQPEEHIQAF
jgi:hypothetical protein